jgi:solute carrier family 34 (sodium-dependent phosphate cotransporter)
VPDESIAAPPSSRRNAIVKTISVILLFYIFFVGIELMGEGCKNLIDPNDTQSFASKLIAQTNNPLIGLFIGLLITSIIQSSGVTSTTVVVLVSNGLLTIPQAIPIVMGANIGTTVTNILVSMGYAMRREEFRRAISAAVVHDFFNVITVILLLPIELLGRALFSVGPLEFLAGKFAAPAWNLISSGPGKTGGILDPLLKPMLNAIYYFTGTPAGPGWAAGLAAGVGLLIIFGAILSFMKLLRSMMLARAERILGRVVGKSGWLGIVFGAIVAGTIHSSSVTTSLMVPLAAAGVATVAQVFPVTLGANIGTTFTALAGSVSTGVTGVTIALVHTFFNIIGILLIYPFPILRRIPIRMALAVGRLAQRSRRTVILGAIAIFYGLPILLILLSRLL